MSNSAVFCHIFKTSNMQHVLKEVKIYHLGEMDMKIVALFPEAVEGPRQSIT